MRAELFGSLGATGHGHGSVKAVVLGLSGEQPDLVDPAAAQPWSTRCAQTGVLPLPGTAGIAFDVDDDIVLHRRKRLQFHPNAMRFTALDAAGDELSARTYYSVGGGFVLGEDEAGQPADRGRPDPGALPVHHRRRSCSRTRAATGLPISGIMLANELVRRDARRGPRRTCCTSGP